MDNIHHNNNNINFGQLMPTKILIKSALGRQNFEESKFLNQTLGVKYSGYLGFHKRAGNIAKNVIDKNENFRKIIENIKSLPDAQQTFEIDKIVSSIGENIDVII